MKTTKWLEYDGSLTETQVQWFKVYCAALQCCPSGLVTPEEVHKFATEVASQALDEVLSR